MKKQGTRLNDRGFYSLIGLLLALVVIYVLVMQMMRSVSKKSGPGPDKRTLEAVGEYGVNASSYTSMLDDIQTRLANASQQERDRLKAMEQLQ